MVECIITGYKHTYGILEYFHTTYTQVCWGFYVVIND